MVGSARSLLDDITDKPGEIFELSVISDCLGGNMEMVHKLLKVFLEKTPAIIDEMHQHCTTGNIKNVASCCHKLKSSARSVGATRLADLCVALETAIKEGRLEDIKEVEPYIDSVFFKTQTAIVNLVSR